MFAMNNDIALVTAKQDINLEALATSINLLSKLNITQTANRITITAKEEIVLNGAGSFITLNASGITSGSNGPFKVHSAGSSFVGPQNMPAAIAQRKAKTCPQSTSAAAIAQSATAPI
jgi:type VI secretion system secreted protein VgrG